MKNFKIAALDHALTPALTQKINQKTKPVGALGQLEQIALQIGLIQQTLSPQLINPAVLVFAGDHGIAASGVSPYPQAVTAQMVLNFLNGGAAINVFARQNNIDLRVIDAGVNHQFAPHPQLIDAKIAMGTANFLHAPAMDNAQCERALTHGQRIAKTVLDKRCNILAFGEMGIGNTSSASCLMSVICGIDIAQCVGRGTGHDDAGLARKTQLLQQALHRHAASIQSPQDALRTFGGFEIAMMAGAMLEAAAHRAVLLIDGFITTAALLVAAQLAPAILEYCIFAHCSDEQAHGRLLSHLQAKPLLNAGLRLGEGTGAVLAYPLVSAAVRFLNEMASFESAGVSEKTA